MDPDTILREFDAVLREEESHLVALVSLWRSGEDPVDWPDPYRQIFAQSCIPHVRRFPGRRPSLTREHAKGLRLAGRMWLGKTTFERLPLWVREAARPEKRDPRWERMAERTRHNLVRRVEMAARREAVAQCDHPTLQG